MIENITKWIDSNPSSFTSLIAAILAASVAITVMALTHFLTRKRERTPFLTNKLEALYLLINQASENNVHHFKLVKFSLMGDQNSLEKLHSIDELDLYGHRQAKQIIMLIRLYFPKLSFIHQSLFAAQRVFNDQIFQIYTENSPDIDHVTEATGRVGHLLRLMEEEMVKNQRILLQDHSIFMRYKKTTIKDINAELQVPEVPITNMES